MDTKDQMVITILPDGTIKTTTSSFSPARHQDAESFLGTVAQLAGGETIREKRSDKPQRRVADESREPQRITQ